MVMMMVMMVVVMVMMVVVMMIFFHFVHRFWYWQRLRFGKLLEVAICNMRKVRSKRRGTLQYPSRMCLWA